MVSDCDRGVAMGRIHLGIRGWARALVVGLVGFALGACDDSEAPTFEVRIVAEPVTGNAPLVVTFDSESRGPLGASYTYAWDFGDGQTSDEATPTHTFEAVGAYPVRLVMTADGGGGSGEATTTIEVAASADLAVSEVAFTPRRVRAGTEMRVTWTVQNLGAPVVGDFDQLIVLSSDEVFEPDSDDIVLARLVGPDDLGLGGSSSEELAFALPEGVASGDLRLGVVLDVDGRVGDSDRSNNAAFAGPTVQVRNPSETGADLVICGLSIDAFDMLGPGVEATAQVSDQLSVEVCLGNNGDALVALGRYALYLSDDDVLDDGDALAGVRAGLPLEPGDRVFNDELIDLSVDAGEYWLFAVADPDEEIDEQLEDNNQRVYAQPIRVVEPGEVEGVDLVISAMELTGDELFWGQTLGVDLTLVNRGDTAVQRNFVVQFDAIPINGGAAIRIGADNIGRLGAGESVDRQVDIAINRRIPAGEYRIVGFANPTGTGDVNEANNRRTWPAVVRLGGEPNVDPSVSGAGIDPLMVEAGSTIDVVATVANGGTDPTGAIDGAIVLSVDSFYDRTDVVVDTFRIDNLTGNGRQELRRQVVIPVELDQQVESWRVAVVIDPDDRVTGEASEDNNVSFAPDPLVVTGAMGGCAEDGFEPNDAPGEAMVIEPGRSEGLGACDMADYFAVVVPAGEVLDVSLEWVRADGQLALRLTDEIGIQIAPTDGVAGRAVAFVEPADAERTVLIEVRQIDRALQYDLDVVLTPRGAGPNLRVRGVIAQPRVVAPGAPLGVAFDLVNVGGALAAGGEAGVLTTNRPDLSMPVLRGAIDTPAVAPGAIERVEGGVMLPPDLADGVYALLVRADEGDVVDEESEDDNIGLSTMQVDAAGACTPDAFEPNASPYEAGAAPRAAPIAAGTHPGLYACRGDDDWYAIALEPGQRLTATATFMNGAGDLELELYGPDGVTLVDESTTLQGTERVEVLRAGGNETYFLRVYLAGAAAGRNTYALEVEIEEAEACEDDGFEPNGDRENGALLRDGLHDLRLCPGDVDWFRFAIAAGNTVSWQVSSGMVGVVIGLYDLDGNLIDEDDNRIVHTARYNGAYYLRASVDSPLDVSYSLRISGVSGVDLSLDQLVLSRAGASVGGDVRAQVQISNERGDVARDVQVRFYLSDDDLPSADDRLIAERVIAQVAGASEVAIDQRLDIPADAEPGAGYIIARIDPDRLQPDARPSNNDAAARFEVRAECVDDDNRDNESPVTSDALMPAAGSKQGVICAFTEDWYNLLAGPGLVRLTLDFEPTTDFDLLVLDGNTGNPIAAAASEDVPEVLEIDMAERGLIIIGVDGFDDASGAYTLSWELP